VDIAGLSANTDPHTRAILFAKDAWKGFAPIVVSSSSGSAAGKSSCAASTESSRNNLGPRAVRNFGGKSRAREFTSSGEVSFS
jgi:hypothetical protein